MNHNSNPNGILKTSENIKLTKTDLEVLEKNVSFFPPDLFYKERKPKVSENKVTSNNQFFKPITYGPIKQMMPNNLNTPNYKNKSNINMNKMIINNRPMGMRFT